MQRPAILVLNAGSSSLKFALFEARQGCAQTAGGAVTGIDTDASRFTLTATSDAEDVEREGAFPNRHTALAAAAAIRYLCYHVRRHLVALTAPLEGLHRLVFTGGIGANFAPVRELVCAGLGYLGVRIDHEANLTGQKTISAPGAPVIVEIRQTDEEWVIADHVARLCVECASERKEAS